LEPGDLLLLYTEGLTEARQRNGNMLTIPGLGEFIEREAAAGQTAPETCAGSATRSSSASRYS
jgi:serine phosphatase RsbU (regulator of sigma subunit)